MSASVMNHEERVAALNRQQVLHVGELPQVFSLLMLPQPPSLPGLDSKVIEADLTLRQMGRLWWAGQRLRLMEGFVWLLAGAVTATLVLR